MSYFDHNATTPLDERVFLAMLPYLHDLYGNPASLYRLGRIGRTAIDYAREQVAGLVGVAASQVIFTSGGTEANHLAFAGLRPGARFALSGIEHPSVLQQAMRLQERGSQWLKLTVDSNGHLGRDTMASLRAFKADFVSMMLANNETGVIEDVRHYAQALHAENVIVHTDAVQALGKIPVSFTDLAVHLMSLSSHKIYGPKGCGALIYAKDVPITPLLVGGGQEQALRAGTENVAAIVGFGKAAELAQAELSSNHLAMSKLKADLEQALHLLPNLTIFAEQSPRLPNTVQFGIDGIDGEMLLMKLDKHGFAVSSGSACASGDTEPSPVLLAMGIAPEQAKTAVRVSLGKSNTEADIRSFISCLKTLI